MKQTFGFLMLIVMAISLGTYTAQSAPTYHQQPWVPPGKPYEDYNHRMSAYFKAHPTPNLKLYMKAHPLLTHAQLTAKYPNWFAEPKAATKYGSTLTYAQRLPWPLGVYGVPPSSGGSDAEASLVYSKFGFPRPPGVGSVPPIELAFIDFTQTLAEWYGTSSSSSYNLGTFEGDADYQPSLGIIPLIAMLMYNATYS
jgi:hypothetical protein